MMSFIYALVVPILILGLGLLHLFIIENNPLPDWLERALRSSGSLWTYGMIVIPLAGLLDI